MARVVKEKLPLHVVVVDTNILWFKEKGPPVNPDFDSWWDENCTKYQLELVIPYVVLGELFFQQTTSADKVHDKISEYCSEISEIIDDRIRNKISRESIKAKIDRKLSRWLASRNARVAPVPFPNIDFPRMVEDAIGRNPPFEYDPKNAKNEKGFRDALILETVVDIVRRESARSPIVFVCGDYLLRESAKQRLKGEKAFIVYQSLADFSSYLKLTSEKLTNEFISGILIRAQEKYYTSDDPNCILNKGNILDRLLAEHSSEMGNPTDPEINIAFSSPTSFLNYPRWTTRDPGKWQLEQTLFDHVEGDKIYFWKSGLVFIRSFTKMEMILNQSLSPRTTNRTLFMKFQTTWKARVKTDGRFHDIEEVETVLEEKEFREPTQQEISKYKLEEI